MSPSPDPGPAQAGPPSKHQLALMIWLCVFPTLTAINVVFGDWLGSLSPVLRTFVLATVAVPIVIYVLMPRLHRIRTTLLPLSWRAGRSTFAPTLTRGDRALRPCPTSPLRLDRRPPSCGADDPREDADRASPDVRPTNAGDAS